MVKADEGIKEVLLTLLAVACLSYPLWGTFSIVALSCFADNHKWIDLEKLILFVGFIGILLSATPFYKSEKLDFVAKILVVIAYFVGCVPIYIFFGWAILSKFCNSY